MTGTLIRKSIFNLRMLAVNVIIVSIFIVSMIINGRLSKEIFLNVNILEVYISLFAFSPFAVFAGLFPGIPYAYSYIEERNCGYLKFIEIRMSRVRYRWQKIFFTGLSGGISLSIPVILIFILLDVITVDVTPQDYPTIMLDTIWKPYFFIWGGRFILILKAILTFLFGFMWAELSLLCSLVMKNKYIAFILPFVIYEVTWLLITQTTELFTPMMLVRSDFDVSVAIWKPFAVDIAYIAFLSVANNLLFKWREKQ